MSTTASATLEGEFGGRELPQVPTRIAQFRVVAELGRGGSGVVVEAKDEGTSATVALKFLRSTEPGRVSRFKEEVRRVTSLRHPNLLVPYELASVDGFWFFTMERIHGSNLAVFVQSGATPAERLERARSAFGQLVSAVDALHSDGLMHLDLKPGNVLVRSDGHVFVLDFGTSRSLGRGTEPALASGGGPIGTPDYWAPEQAWARTQVPESDWYSVGIMLFEALVGRLPSAEERQSAAPAALPEELGRAFGALVSAQPEARVEGAAQLGGSRDGTAPRKAPRIIGRDAELDRLAAALSSARSRRVTSVLVHGAPGAGKSALVQEFLQRVATRGERTLIVTGRCYERESVPYKGLDAVMDALSAHLSARAGALPADVARAAQRAAALFPILATPSPWPSTGRTLEPSAQRQSAVDGVRELLVALAREQPVIISLDDVQWADDDTKKLLNDVLSATEPSRLLLVMTSRYEGHTLSTLLAPWEALLLSGAFSTIAVDPLSLELAVALAASLAGDAARGEEIARAADGNPFLVEELALRAGPTGTGADIWAEVIGQRLATLSADAGRALKLTVLMGRPVEESVVLGALDVSHAAPLWAELRRQALLRTRHEGARVVLETWHDRVQQAVRSQVSASEARGLHAELGRALANRGAPAAELAAHFQASDQPGLALPHYKVAASEAWAVLAFDRAAQLYAAALELEPTASASREELVASLAESLFNAGKGAAAAPHFLELAKLRSGVPSRQAQIRATEAYLGAGHIDEGMTLARELIVSTPGAARTALPTGLSVAGQIASLLLRGVDARPPRPRDRDAEVASDLYWTLSKGFIYLLPVDATDFLLRSLRLALRAQSVGRVGRGLGLVGAGMFMQIPPLAKTGAGYLERATRIGRETDDAYLIAMSEVWGAFSEVYPGRWRCMFDRSQRGTHILRERCVGVAWEAAIAEGLSAWALQFMGKLTECEKHCISALQIAKGSSDLYSEILFSQYLAYAEIAAGRRLRARERIESTRDRWTKRSYTIPHFYAMFLLALADLTEHRAESALQRFVVDRGPFLKAGGQRTPMGRIDFNALEARVHLSVSDQAARTAKLRPLEHLARALAKETRADCAGHAAFVRAAHATRRGERGLAREQWRACEDAYTEADMGMHAACASLRFAELEQDEHAHADACERIEQSGVADPRAWADALMPSGDLRSQRG